MGQEWLQEFEDGETRAVCSKCGVPYRYPRELTLENDGFFYCNRCREQTVLTRDRIQAQSRKRREQPPPKRVQPPQYAEDYSLGESYILSSVLLAAPADTPGGSPDELAASWSAIYLGAMVNENRRPTAWVSAAKAKLITCCDYILTQQYGSPTGISPALASTDIRYGGILVGAIAGGTGIGVSVAGSALLAGYNVTGDTKYLDGAERNMQFARGMQCSDLLANANDRVVFPAGGSPYHTGCPILLLTTGGAVQSSLMFISSAGQMLRFVNGLIAIRGTSATYGTVSGSFTATTVATLATIRDELVNFLTVGVNDSVTGTVIAPISITTPKNLYTPYLAAGGGTGTWTAGTTAPVNSCYCLTQLYLAGQTTSALAYYDWLMSFTSNSANRAASGAPADAVALTNKGTYDPTISLASALNATTKQDATGTTTRYYWAAAGLLAPLQSIRNPSGLAAAKVILEGKYQSPRGPTPRLKPFSPIGLSGLSFQPGTAANSTYFSSQLGLIYRSPPQSFGDQFTNPRAA